MPRGKKESYALAEDGDGRLTPVRATGSSTSVPSLSSLSPGEARTAAADGAFIELMARTDGWLRCIPCGEGKLNYFKWKFTNGHHKGKYVMFVGAGQDWVGGILGLFEKLEEVDRGVRAPALDTFYDPR